MSAFSFDSSVSGINLRHRKFLKMLSEVGGHFSDSSFLG